MCTMRVVVCVCVWVFVLSVRSCGRVTHAQSFISWTRIKARIYFLGFISLFPDTCQKWCERSWEVLSAEVGAESEPLPPGRLVEEREGPRSCETRLFTAG